MQLIRSSKPVFPQEDITPLLGDIRQVLESGQFRNGPNVTVFEKMVAQYVGVGHGVAFDSDSSAYETVLHYFGVDDGEVIVCTNSFVSVPNSVVAAGGKVVFADIKENSLAMDPESLLKNISPRTRGVIVTHIAGYPNPDLQRIQQICREYGLFMVEDATHAIGATVNSQKAGSFGDAAVFAFTPTKVLTTGEGGMLVSDNYDLCDFAKKFSFYGSGVGKTNFVNLGRHMVLPEISAILGIYQLKRAEEFIARRNHIARTYNEAFEEIGDLKTFQCPPENRCSYYKYPLILGNNINKSEFTRMMLDDFGIETGNIFYPPCHLQGVYKKLGAFSYGTLSTAEAVLSRTITLPMHVGLSDADVEYVIDRVRFLVSKSS